MRRSALVLLFVAACSTSTNTSAAEATQAIGDFRYAPLAEWTHNDTQETSRLLSRWMPKKNAGKESLSIIRVPLTNGISGMTAENFSMMLRLAQGTLPSASVEPPTVAKTKQHLQVVQVVANFVPVGLSSRYHRVHAMLVDGNALIHVIYTARTPDPDLTMFHQVVDTIRRGEG